MVGQLFFGWESSCLVPSQEHVAVMLRDGARVERLWAEYVRNQAPPAYRRQVQEAMERLQESEGPSRWPTPPASPAGRVRLHMRLLLAAPKIWRDMGHDLRGSAGIFLDDEQVEVLERRCNRRDGNLRIEDEHWLSASADQYEDAFLRATTAWPRLPTGEVLPLGASVRALPVISEDRRYVTLHLRLSLAVPVGPPTSEAAAGTTVRMLPRSTVSIPVSGALLVMARAVLCCPERAAPTPPNAEDEAQRYVLLVGASLE
jgi:hypothetical protein